MDDRRVFARIDVKLPLKFLNPVNGDEGDAQTFNISANGIGFTTAKELSPNALFSSNTRLELWLEIPDKHEALYARGEVVWVRGARIGVHLEKAELMGLARVLWMKRNANKILDPAKNS